MQARPILIPTSILVATLLLLSVFAMAPAFAGNGNGVPPGKHYTLNVLGKTWVKGDNTAWTDLSNDVIRENNGHVIFVKLNGNTKILLQEDTTSPYDFKVIDADGTDGVAVFQLPDPGAVVDPDSDAYNAENAAYLIYVRVLGKPTGSATMKTVAFNETDGTITQWIASAEVLYLDQSKRPPAKFEDVTQYLTTILADWDGDGQLERIKIFDPRNEGYLWDYENNGLKHVQFRFVPTALFPE